MRGPVYLSRWARRKDQITRLRGEVDYWLMRDRKRLRFNILSKEAPTVKAGATSCCSHAGAVRREIFTCQRREFIRFVAPICRAPDAVGHNPNHPRVCCAWRATIVPRPQLHSSSAGPSSEQVGIAGDGVLMPALVPAAPAPDPYPELLGRVSPLQNVPVIISSQ
jgi:hypothetical protein